ncbi:MAG TPA: DNA gyrase inhibitor YacG [Terriglobia bacterium]|nr:DNA gyrase inhibitor YacG [Terriglobia bacterium]
MRCPICKTEVPGVGNPNRPFCSERCKMIDLDNWLSERYRISSPDDAEAPDQDFQTDFDDQDAKGKRG